MGNVYTQPVTFVDGTPLVADDVNSNLVALQESIAQGISSASVFDVSSIPTSKILRPRTDYAGLDTQSTYFQSGSIHSIQHPLLFWLGKDPLSNVPFQTRGFITNVTSPVSAGAAGFQPVPQSWVTFYAEKTPLAVLVRVTAQVIIPNDSTGATETDNRFHIRLIDSNNTQHDDLGSTCRVREQDTNPINDMRAIATQSLFTTATQGYNHVGIVYGLSSNFGLLGGMTMTIEIWY